MPVLSLCVADTFGGASVLACGAERTAMVPGARLGLSGPAVIETAHGRSEVDASDADAVAALFGAQARSDAGCVDLVDDDADAVRDWIDAGIGASAPFAAWVHAMQQRLAARLAAMPDAGLRRQDARAIDDGRRSAASGRRRSMPALDPSTTQAGCGASAIGRCG